MTINRKLLFDLWVKDIQKHVSKHYKNHPCETKYCVFFNEEFESLLGICPFLPLDCGKLYIKQLRNSFCDLFEYELEKMWNQKKNGIFFRNLEKSLI